MSKHTPGPWQWDGKVFDYDPKEDAPWLVDANGKIILSGEITCEGEANARLIAAAPDLLAALEVILPAIERDDLRTIILAAIAKASDEY